jgi:hypothetical protein
MAGAWYGVAFTIGSRHAARVVEICSPGNLQPRTRLLTCPWVRQLGVVMGRFAGWRLGAALGATLAAAQPALADQVVSDDLIIKGSICSGVRCDDGEVFGSSTGLFKATSFRLDFIDTSGSGFATRDWRLETNGFGSGAGDYFAIKDMGDTSPGTEGGTAIVKVMAGAPENSVFVDPLGRVGIGTAAPGDELHIRDGDSPGVTLEQDGSDGFQPKTWRIFGNEDELAFQVAGVSKPFAIDSDAPNAALILTGSGRIGVGTTDPIAPLDIRATTLTVGTGNSVLKLVNADGPTAFQLHPFGTGFFWNFAAADNNTFRINRSGNGATEMELNGSGNLTITGTIKTAGPTCASGCDAVFDAGYDLPSIEEHAEAMWAKKHLPIVGPTLPNEPVDLSERYGLMLNELETAHIYIEQLHREKAELRAELEAQRVQVETQQADLKAQQDANDERFARLETALSSRMD